MATFKNQTRHVPAISTASLPDIVFMLLFFFMTVTTMKDTDLFVENQLPSASEVSKLDKKDRVIQIYVGKPKAELLSRYGTEPLIQVGEKIVQMDALRTYLLEEISKRPEELRNYLTVSLKADKEVKVGIVTDIKKELQQLNLLKINYTSIEDPS
ncbi:biopolymer transporter ExbD [Allomuricauda sp. NBRC 101325]|uniref:ExbD/TolR family protein n=1 Tax=Allomuricauda sp. NBRC 101325 TaxID=1113758 RepID=UPI0024A43952|nr:biopolymer transporter ExbD [Muricauda sp. NBRC 101325]GLU42777.1 biopolymer transporter ExbD [Muricauda sp. NBRC 101325]